MKKMVNRVIDYINWANLYAPLYFPCPGTLTPPPPRVQRTISPQKMRSEQESLLDILLFPTGFHEEVEVLARYKFHEGQVSQVYFSHFQGGVAVPSIPKPKKILRCRE